MKNIKVIQIAFNMDDLIQKELYDYVKSHNNVSLYGKSVIQKDKDGLFKNSEETDDKEISANLEGFLF